CHFCGERKEKPNSIILERGAIDIHHGNCF
ncbi:MAG: hypothetical protein ACI8UX_001629, partial [Psychromonas sp.]